MGLKKNHHQQTRNKSQQRMKKKPRRVSNLGLLANPRTRSKNEDGFDERKCKEVRIRRKKEKGGKKNASVSVSVAIFYD